jgi:TolB protein
MAMPSPAVFFADRFVKAGVALRLGVLGAFASVAGLVLATQSPAAFPGQNGKIAFVNYRDGDSEIFRMNPNGSDQDRLTRNSANDAWPSFAPGGRRIVFVSDRDGNSEIYVMRSDGTHQRRITNSSAFDNAPTFSPNGKRIVFTSNRQHPGRPSISNLYVMRTDGSHVRRLIRKPVLFKAAWSPNGKTIAFAAPPATHGGGYELWAMRPDGTRKRQLTRDLGRARFTLNYLPDFSPNGHRIVFMRERNPESAVRIWMMRADGSNPHSFPRTPKRGGVDAVFSPNGKRIAYVNNSSEISVMRADGSHRHQLTHSDGSMGSPSWGVKPR